MIIEKWFSRYGIQQNPFKDEEAKDDAILQKIIGNVNTHPDFEKVYGDPDSPSTSVVFGEKGSGKTALRMLITRRLLQHNGDNPDRRTFVVEYDDWNALLDKYTQRRGRKRTPQKTFSRFRLWDHVDGILCIAVTRLVDHLVDGATLPSVPENGEEQKRHVRAARDMPHVLKRDLALLAALYYRGQHVPFKTRFLELLKTIRLRPARGLAVLRWALLLALLAAAGGNLVPEDLIARFVVSPPIAVWAATAVAGALGILYVIGLLRIWRTARRSARDLAVVGRPTEELSWALKKFRLRDLEDQPWPRAESADNRYQLLARLQEILRRLGYASIVVLVDRVDEPHPVHGDPDVMKILVWPLLDNKFLKQPGMGVKLLLPLELGELMRKEDRHFFDRTRLDKQNLIFPLEWSGAALYDIANARINACREPEAQPISLRTVFEDDVREDDVVDALDQLRQPRDAFKMLYRLVKEHCRLYTEDSGQEKISKILLRSVVKEERERVEAFKGGWGHG